MIRDRISLMIDILESDNQSRYKSYDHFHSVFKEEVLKVNPDVERVTLHMFNYLSSWGMLRGSTFSIHKDYLFHKPVVKILVKYEFVELIMFDLSKAKEDLFDKIIKLKSLICNYYLTQYFISNNHFLDSPSKVRITKVTDTLVSKIIMGSYGCVPAYDEYFKIGFKNTFHQSCSFNLNSLNIIMRFYQSNREEIDKFQSFIKENHDIDYTTMKILDMFFWITGNQIKHG